MTETTQLRAADVLAQRLYAAGCRHAFGMPGGEVLTLLDALQRAGITFHLCKHENAAGFMAEGVHHVDGAPGILLATLGPGAMNGVNVVANAHQDRVPLIVLTGCVDPEEGARYTHQVMDHGAVFAPITKASLTLNAGAADAIADKAIAEALEGRPGPVHIDVPISVAAAPAVDRGRVLKRPVAVAPMDTAPLVAALERAERPIMLIGLDALNEDCADRLKTLVESHNLPFATTYKAKGVIPEDHPMALGGAGLSPLADATLVPLFEQADLVICAGYDPIEMRPGWQDVWDPAAQVVIDITHAPNRHLMHHATYVVEGSIAGTLEALMAAKPRATWPAGQPQSARAHLATAFGQREDWGPTAVIQETRAATPRDVIATIDSGAHRILASQVWQAHAPRHLLQSTGLCTMGCAIPLAGGAALATGRHTIAFTGDAGFLMVAGELSTLAEMNLPVIIVVFVDAQLALIEKKQRGMQLANAGVDFGWHDFAAIAQAFGGQGVTVRSRVEMKAALEAAQAHDGFTVIAAQIDKAGYDGKF